MAVIIKNSAFKIKIDSGKIIGIMKDDYEELINLFTGKKVGFILKEGNFKEQTVKEELCSIEKDDKKVMQLVNRFGFDKDFLDKQIKDLSHGEKRLLQYLKVFLQDERIIVIDDVYLDLDLRNKKIIKNFLKELVRRNKTTIIIGSKKSNDLYDICDKILLIHEKDYCYGDISDILMNEKILNEYHVMMPDILQFVMLCNKKGIKVKPTNDIRDLIKEVYRNV